MCKGVASSQKPEALGWKEVQTLCKDGRKLLVVEGNVYDIGEWVHKHPGGKVLLTYTGEDATDAFNAFHRQEDTEGREFMSKWLKPLFVAPLVKDVSARAKEHQETHDAALESDFRKLRKDLVAAGLFKADWRFYAAMLAHIILLELAGWAILSYYGRGWVPYCTAVVLLVTAQAQAGWLQHDFGHLSVFKSRYLNLLAHKFVILHIKAASSAWWNYRHYLHHAKPNIAEADPDINMPYVFMLGKDMSKKWAKKQREGKAAGVMPYDRQHQYWWVIGPPLLLPVYFHYENLRFLLGNAIFGSSGMWKDSYSTQKYMAHGRWFFWEELMWMLSFFVRWHFMYGPLLGGFWGWVTLYMTVRTVESHWFVWVTQMSHIPMQIQKYDATQQKDWPSLQLNATCNVEGGYFNDWFSGHLNYQIEHHLFPTMPRHNYSKVAPLVKSLYEKHGKGDLYLSKTLLGAFADIVSSLEVYGAAWREAYME